MESRYIILISGNVQGVFFRMKAKELADSLGLTGWIKNKQSGEVESLIEGDAEKVKVYLDWCHNGPELAKVHMVHSTDVEGPSECSSFDIVE